MQKKNQNRLQKRVTKISRKGWYKLKILKELFLKEFDKILNTEIDLHYSTHVPTEEMIRIVAEASQKGGIDCLTALKYFQFTPKEIKEYLKRYKHSVN